MTLRKIAFRNIRRNTRRSILSITAIAVAALAMLMMFSFINGMSNNLADNLQTYMTGEIRVRHSDFDTYEHLNPIHLRIPSYRKALETIHEIEGVTVAVPRINSPGQVYIGDERYMVSGMAIDPELEQSYHDIDERIVEGRLPKPGQNETAIGMALAENMGLGLGESFTMLTQTMHRGTNAVTLTITGLVNFPIDALNMTTIFVPLDRMQYILQMEEGVTDILIRTNGKVDLEETASAISAALQTTGQNDERLEAKAWTNIPSSYQFLDMATAIYNFMALFMFLLGSTVIITTTMMVVFERMKEIGTIAALGMTGQEIVRLFFLEALFLAIIGSGAGVLLGSGITAVWGKIGINFGTALEGISMEVSNIVYPALKFQTVVYIFVFSVVIASAASFLPSRRAAKVEPVQALRTE